MERVHISGAPVVTTADDTVRLLVGLNRVVETQWQAHFRRAFDSPADNLSVQVDFDENDPSKRADQRFSVICLSGVTTANVLQVLTLLRDGVAAASRLRAKDLEGIEAEADAVRKAIADNWPPGA